MPEIVDVTWRKLRYAGNIEGSRFLSLYESLLRRDSLDESELTSLLTFAILFLRADDPIANRLGYRILLQYSSVTGDYEPLHAVASVRELMPVTVAAERLQPALAARRGLADELFKSHRSNFTITTSDGQASYRTRGQMALRDFNSSNENAVVVAPTSYGKSEMMLSKIAERFDRRVCVLVPTRALISQTRATLISDDSVRGSGVRVFTHPDAYVGDAAFIAVMTQERLQRLLANEPDLSLDLVLVDEAHNLLQDDSRAVELSQVLMTVRFRNPDAGVSFYTPFLSSPSSVRLAIDPGVAPVGLSINEHVKAERLVVSRPGSNQRLYDQFLNRFIELEPLVPSDEVEAVRAMAGSKTLVYVNKPSQAQDLALRVAEGSQSELSPSALIAIAAIADLIDPRYSLIDCIRSGVLFHHGKVPDVLRQYIERLFRDSAPSSPRFLITTSTLLEGVNTPADRLIMMSASRGRGYLSRAEFRNLVGRVARFREVFALDRANLDLLQPEVHLVPSSYARADWDVESYLERVADIAKSVEDAVENPLLADSSDLIGRETALEYWENVEPADRAETGRRSAETEAGLACFKNGVRDFDIFEFEELIQARIEQLQGSTLTTEGEVINTICSVFFEGVDLISDELVRVRDTLGARRFYTLFLSWRANNEPYKRMIGHFLSYWAQLEDELVYVGSAWGEETFGSGYRRLYVRMAAKSRAERINLAVAKVKEEQDFVDFNLIRYVEILDSFGVLDPSLYNRLKYGTDNPYLICLLKNGCSPELSRLIREAYSEHVDVDLDQNSLRVSPGLAEAMAANDENDILVYEAETMAAMANYLDGAEG
jgi:hypothetical protein